ncbi:MAG: polysaccharide pyruvyl transferase family protein [Kofleriaceae bacterium]
MSIARSEVVLITRRRTANKGNQALSAAWLAMARRAFPDDAIRVLERRPRHLVQFTLARVAAARDPRRAFDAIVDQAARLAPGAAGVGAPPAEVKIELDEGMPPPDRFGAIRKRLNLRGWAARARLYEAEYRARLAACQRARLVVLNPAGEFFPREPEPAFYHLLDAAVAERLGCPTAMVNHTMDIADPTLRQIIPPLYRRLALVGFRDDKSVRAFREMGGDLGNVVVTPDLALTTPVGEAAPRRPGTVAIAINVPEATAYGYVEGWLDVLAGLRRAGLQIVLVSNEVPTDRAFYARARAELGVAIEGEGLDHDRYAELLGGYELVVSSRMHTAILAMVAGTPVLPVEGSSFKITGLIEQLGLSTAVVQPNRDGWTTEVVTQAVALHARRASVADEVRRRVLTVQAEIDGALVPRLRAVARARKAA